MKCCPKDPASSFLISASSLGQIILRTLIFIFPLYKVSNELNTVGINCREFQDSLDRNNTLSQKMTFVQKQ